MSRKMGKVSDTLKKQQEPLEPELPALPRLPEPPTVVYQRPKAAEDPAERFLKSRGIGSKDAGSMGKAMGIGTALVGSIMGGLVVGWLLDTYLIKSTTPYGLIGGFLLGTVSGFVNLVKMANSLNE
ncbi:AtpZ/AtpI family protein [Armatimonas sp.]|uniref:AtpZ/AtpI family protein n=1 Tax=Armatimonas sp. TaxID=1872638 RepID=UPI003752C886